MLKSIRSKLSIARQLYLQDWLLLIQSWWLLTYFHLSLRRVGFEQLQKQFTLTTGEKIDPSQSLEIAWTLQKLVYMASRIHLLRLACLDRACTLQWMLGKREIPSELRIGISRSQVNIYAHAWVEVAGQAVGEAEDIEEKFTTLSRM